MAFGKVYDVDIVADCGAVSGGVVYVLLAFEIIYWIMDILPSPKTKSLSRWPVATLPSNGSKLNGTPNGSSPIIPLGCEPAGLKYLNSAPFHFSYGLPAFFALLR